MANTTVRNIRVPDRIWQAATEKAEREGTTVSEVVRRYLARWGRQ